ncbi:MAG: glycosyltransferase [Opitutae bacterium]|nr:glycosyltransferase [Opitutae bacterium]
MSGVSVIIPVFNAELFLRECLDSLRAQSFSDWEALCIDDGSTDASGEILREYAKNDPRFVVTTKENSGYGATVNLGIRRSQAKYVAILEPDDKLVPDAYDKLFRAAEENAADVVKGDYNFFWSDGRRERACALRSCPCGSVICAEKERGLFSVPLSVWSAFYRREFLLDRDVFFNETPGASFQDNAFSFKLFAAAQRVFLVDFPVVDYRQDNPGSSIKSKEKTFCMADEIHEIERWLAARPELARKFRYDFFLFKYKAYFGNLLRTPRERQGDFLALFSREFREARDRKELPEELFSRLKKRLPLLLDAPEKFLRYARLQSSFDAFKRAKRNIFSFRRSRAGWKITLCGKTF